LARLARVADRPSGIGLGRPDGRSGIDAALVRRLVRSQFPEWGDLPIVPVEVDGWDNRTFHLGDQMSVRLPTAAGYAPSVEKEQRFLPFLAPQLPLPVPVPLAKGVPGEGYPYHWSVNRWLPGEAATFDRISDLTAFAASLAQFLTALQGVDASAGPPAGAHSFFRGGALTTYDDETRRSIALLADRMDGGARIQTERALAVWEAALSTEWSRDPVWFHGDVAAGNLLVEDGRLVAVIDFGTSGVGDPACDLVIAWTMFSGPSRETFRRALPLDAGAWARARGWSLWKALITLAANIDTDPVAAAAPRQEIDEVIADHELHG
jgi:aminoglycoside phosphotransferase (APT) family kinase protein